MVNKPMSNVKFKSLLLFPGIQIKNQLHFNIFRICEFIICKLETKLHASEVTSLKHNNCLSKQFKAMKLNIKA